VSAIIEVDGARLCVTARIADADPEVVYLPESQFQRCGDASIGIDCPGHSESQAP
jgi:hypothetical protein